MSRAACRTAPWFTGNPLSVIEQLTYLLFIKRLDGFHNETLDIRFQNKRRKATA